MDYRSTREKVITKLRDENGIRVWHIHTYFSNSLVKNNYGISGITIEDNSYLSEIIFHVIDEKKFLTKVIKYGF